MLFLVLGTVAPKEYYPTPFPELDPAWSWLSGAVVVILAVLALRSRPKSTFLFGIGWGVLMVSTLVGVVAMAVLFFGLPLLLLVYLLCCVIG